MKYQQTLILAIGNKLLSDEGVGLHVLEALEKLHPATEGVSYVDGGTLSFTLANAVSEADNLIVIDAAQLKSPAGTVRCMVNEQMDSFLGSCKRSVHEIGLLDLLDISRLTETLPENRALVGIQPDVIDWGDSLTASVEQAVPEAIEHVVNLLEQWKGGRMSGCANANGCAALNTGNDILILHEIRHALDKLLTTGENTTIDLRSIPMAPGEEARIEETLGEGEISVKLNALGISTIIETGISGVWLITHYNVEDEILGKFIEITRLPSLIESQTEEIEKACQI